MNSSSLGPTESLHAIPDTSNFIFPPTIILENGIEKDDYRDIPNLNMCIFFILIMLYDFAHDHIKSTERIAPVDTNFLKFCSQTKEEFKKERKENIGKKQPKLKKQRPTATKISGILGNTFASLADSDSDTDGGGSSQKGGGLEYVEDCFSDMKNTIDFILFSIISYMDIEGIFQRDSNNLYDRIIGNDEAKKLIISQKGMLKNETEDLTVNERELDLCYFCFVVNLIFTKYTDMDTEDNLTQFILKYEKNNLFVAEIEDLSSTDVFSAVSSNDISSSSEKSINFISDNCSSNGIKIIKHSILEAVCESYNSTFGLKDLFQILLRDDFFSIFIKCYLKNHGFSNNNDDSIGNTILSELDPAQIKASNEAEGVRTNMAEVVSDKSVRSPDSVTEFHDIESKNTTDIKTNLNYEGGQHGGIDKRTSDAIYSYLIDTTANIKNPSIYLNNQVFRLYVCTVLTQLKILSPDPHSGSSFTPTDFGVVLLTNKPEINVVNDRNNIKRDAPTHPTLYILREILQQLEPVWTNDRSDRGKNKNIFSNYGNIESDLEDFFYRLSTGIPNFLGTFPVVNGNENGYIYNNASNVLGYNDGKEFTMNYLPNYQSNNDIIGKKNIIISDAAIIDAFGQSNIDFKKSLELKNRLFYIRGMNKDNNQDNNFEFNGVINVYNNENKGEIVNSSTIMLGSYEQGDHPLIHFQTNCRVGVVYQRPFVFDVDKKLYKQEKIQIITKNKGYSEEDFVFDINDTLLSSELSNIRHFMLRKLVSLIDDNNSFENNGKKQRINVDLFQNCYMDINGINELISITLGKTECDLLQILVTVLKHGGHVPNDSISYVSDKVLGYFGDGNGLRVISHNDLTASIITYFMLIFGYYTWEFGEDKFIPVLYDDNTGKNELAFLNDTRLSRFAVGNYSKLQEVYGNNNNFSFNCVDIVDCSNNRQNIEARAQNAERQLQEANEAREAAQQQLEQANQEKTEAEERANICDEELSQLRENQLVEGNQANDIPVVVNEHGNQAEEQGNQVEPVAANQPEPVRKKKREEDDDSSGRLRSGTKYLKSSGGSTRRVKNKKYIATRKYKQVFRKKTIKHHRKKNNTKRT